MSKYESLSQQIADGEEFAKQYKAQQQYENQRIVELEPHLAACQQDANEMRRRARECGNELEEMFKDLQACQQERDRLRAALKDARDMVQGWAAYASDYFQKKHDLAGDLQTLDDAINGVARDALAPAAAKEE